MKEVVKLVLTLKEMSELLGICRNTAYKLVASEGFPVIRVGRKYLIPVDGLREWLKTNSGKEFDE